MPPTCDLHSTSAKSLPTTPSRPFALSRTVQGPRHDFTSHPRHRHIYTLNPRPPSAPQPPHPAVHDRACLAFTPPDMEVANLERNPPIFAPSLYEFEVLRVKHGHVEDNLTQALEAKAKALGLDITQLQPPPSRDEDAVAELSLARRDSNSGDTQASGRSYDFNTPPSPNSFDQHDYASPSWLNSLSTSPAPMVPYVRSPLVSTPVKKSLKERLKLVLSKTPPSRDNDSPRSSFSGHSRTTRSFRGSKGQFGHDLPSGQERSAVSTDSWTDTLLKNTISRPSSSDSSLARRSRHPDYQAAWKLGMQDAKFRELWEEHSRVWYRMAIFEVKQRALLEFYIEFSRNKLGEQCDRLRRLQDAEHARDLERLEEKQLSLEMSLAKAHEDESRQAFQALSYMRAYIDNPLGSRSGRVITEEDYKRLRSQELHVDELARDHKAALKMLRARQEVGFKHRKDTHKQWKLQLSRLLKDAWDLLEDTAVDLRNNRLPTLIHERRRRCLTRWRIALAIWDKELGSEADTPDLKHLANVPWPEIERAESLAGSTSSMLDTYYQTTFDLHPIVTLTHNGVFAAPTSADLPAATQFSAYSPAARMPATAPRKASTTPGGPTPSDTPPKQAFNKRWSTMSHLRGSTGDWRNVKSSQKQSHSNNTTPVADHSNDPRPSSSPVTSTATSSATSSA